MRPEEKFKEITAKCGEYFNDYMILARSGDLMLWRASDDTWAFGASSRFNDHIINKDRFNDLKTRLREEE